MNGNLFNRLYSIMNAEFSGRRFTKDNLFFFLIGAYSSAPGIRIDYSVVKTEDILRCISGQKRLCTIFGDDYPAVYKLSQNLQLDDLAEVICTKIDPGFASRVIKRFLSDPGSDAEKYSAQEQENQAPEFLLSQLFTECIKEDYPLFASYKKQLPKQQTLALMVGRRNDADRLKTALDRYHKIILSDQYGAGKSCFVKYCLSMWKLQDYCYVCYDECLETTLNTIRYKNKLKQEDTVSPYSGLMNNCYSSSLLVIDNMYYSPDFSKELEQLACFAVNIIVITVHSIHSESFYSFKMTPFSDEEVVEIFNHHSDHPLESRHFQKLIDVTQRNALMVSLLAYQCRRINSNPDCDVPFSDTALHLLSRFDRLDNHLEINTADKNSCDKTYINNSATFKHPHNSGKSLNLIGHLKVLYTGFFQNPYRNSQKESALYKRLRDTMKYLCCFGWSPIPLAFLSIVLPGYDINDLTALSEMGLLLLTDENVQMTPLVSHAVFASENPCPADFYNLVNNLVLFLQDYDQTLCIPYLGGILLTFIQTLYPSVCEQNNKGQKSASKEFELWQELLYHVFYYYSQCGNFNTAERAESEMREIELASTHNSIDREFFKLAIHMQQLSDPYEIVSMADEIQAKLIFNVPVDFNYFFAAAQDLFIERQCVQLLRMPFYPMTNRDSDMARKTNKCIDSFMPLFAQDIPGIKLSSSDEKRGYYQLCRSYLFQHCTLEDILLHLHSVKKYGNANYRIKATAFLLFMAGCYLYDSITISNMHPDIALQVSNKYLLPEVHDLRSQIQNCKLIPFSTTKICLYAYIQASLVELQLVLSGQALRQFIHFILNDALLELVSLGSLSQDDLNTAKKAIVYINSQLIPGL